jgi:hypothetical protein
MGDIVERFNEYPGIGIPYNNIRCIQKGEFDDVWVGTSKGASRFNVKSKKWNYYLG